MAVSTHKGGIKLLSALLQLQPLHALAAGYRAGFKESEVSHSGRLGPVDEGPTLVLLLSHTHNTHTHTHTHIHTIA